MTTCFHFLMSLPLRLSLLGLLDQRFKETSQHLSRGLETILERFKYRLPRQVNSCRHLGGLTQILPTINLLPITL
jgi:hypothetical protein